jgi:hypothetical protein
MTCPSSVQPQSGVLQGTGVVEVLVVTPTTSVSKTQPASPASPPPDELVVPLDEPPDELAVPLDDPPDELAVPLDEPPDELPPSVVAWFPPLELLPQPAATRVKLVLTRRTASAPRTGSRLMFRSRWRPGEAC